MIALCALWTLLGLVGHDPWKSDEAYNFGLVYSILQGSDWVIPMLAGEPFMEKPPLYYLTSAALAKLFSGWLPLHDGARLASGFYMGLALIFTGLTARELWGKGYGRISVLIMIACLGLVVRTHQIITDTALLAGVALALYGLALAPRRPVIAGIIIGSGMGIGFMSKGLFEPGVIAITALLLPLLSKPGAAAAMQSAWPSHSLPPCPGLPSGRSCFTSVHLNYSRNGCGPTIWTY